MSSKTVLTRKLVRVLLQGFLMLLAGTSFTARAAAEPPGRQGAAFWPIYYCSDDGRHEEAAAFLYGRHNGWQHLGPVVWGHDKFHVMPLYWSGAKDWVLLPAAWSIGESKGVGPAWWNTRGDFTVFPLMWREGENWLVPGAWSWDGSHGVGPVWWWDHWYTVFPIWWQCRDEPGRFALVPVAGRGKTLAYVGPFWWERKDAGAYGMFPLVWKGTNETTVFPLWWQRGKDWTLFPLAWHRESGANGVLPLCWKKDEYFNVLPVLWTGRSGWCVPLVAWHNKDTDNTGVMPVTWGKDHFAVLPLYWSWHEGSKHNQLLFPLAWDVNQHRGIGPVWRSGNNWRVFPLFWSEGKDWTLLPLAWQRPTHSAMLPLYASWTGKDGVKRAYLPLLLGWSEQSKAGVRDTHLLACAINHESGPDGYEFQLQPLLQVRGGKSKQVALLWRLFEYGEENGTRYCRFLYLPKKWGAG